MQDRTRLYAVMGAAAGPLFTLSWLLAGAGRQDYDPLRHPVSSLSIGESGWVQTATFFACGLLMLGFGVGLRRVWRNLGLSKWAPVFILAAGAGLVGAGLFVTDPMNGYPPGTALIPTDFTLTGRLHRLFSAAFFIGVPAAAFAFGRWFSRSAQSGWTRYSRLSAWAFLAVFVVTTVGFLQVGGLDDIAGLLQRLSITIGWVWVTAIATFLAQGWDAIRETMIQ